jgi:hypothetical protein
MDFAHVGSEPMIAFRDGRVVPYAVIAWLHDVERRGGRFEIFSDGGWRLLPRGTLTVEDHRFMFGHRRLAQIHHAIACFSNNGLGCFRD